MDRSRAAILGMFIAASAIAADPVKKDPSAEPPVVRSLSYSPDGTRLAAAVMPRTRGGSVLVWDTSTRKLVANYDRAGASPIAVFASDGKAIVVANGRKVLTVIDPKSGEKTGELGPFSVEVTSVRSAGPGRWVALDKAKAFHLWDEKANKARVIAKFKEVWSWTVSPGGKWLFVTGETGERRLFNLIAGDEVKGIFKVAEGSVDEGTFVTEDRMLLAANSGWHRVVDLPGGQEVFHFKNEGGAGGVAFSPASGMLACRYHITASASLTPLTFRPPTDAETARVTALLKDCDSDDYTTRLKASAALVELGSSIEPLLRDAAATGPSAEVRMRARIARETIMNKPKFRLAGHRDEIRPMTFSPDGKVFATGAADGLVILWDTETGKEVARLKAGGD